MSENHDDIGHIECWEQDEYPTGHPWTLDDVDHGDLVCHFSPGHTEDSNLDWPKKLPVQDDEPKFIGEFNSIHLDGSKIEELYQQGYDYSHHMRGQILIGMDDVTCTFTENDHAPDRVYCGRNPTQEITEDDFDGRHRR